MFMDASEQVIAQTDGDVMNNPVHKRAQDS